MHQRSSMACTTLICLHSKISRNCSLSDQALAIHVTVILTIRASRLAAASGLSLALFLSSVQRLPGSSDIATTAELVVTFLGSYFDSND